MSHKRDDTAEIITWYQQGLTLRQIGQRVGITGPAVRSVLVHNGVTPRTPKEAYDLRFPKGRAGETAANWKGGRRLHRPPRTPSRVLSPEALAQMVTSYQQGERLYTIAQTLGRSEPTVRKLLLAQGVTLRTQKANCQLRRRGPTAPHWKGGRRFHSPPTDERDAYVYIHQPDHPAATKNGYVMEHRLVMERTLGRALRPDEIVHHINHCRSDNRPENLEVLSNGDHIRRHFESGREKGELIRENEEWRRRYETLQTELQRRCDQLQHDLTILRAQVSSPTP